MLSISGTGKTLMARQIGKMLSAREPKIVNGPEILNKYVGESEANIRSVIIVISDFQLVSSFFHNLYTYYEYTFRIIRYKNQNMELPFFDFSYILFQKPFLRSCRGAKEGNNIN